MYLQTCFSRNIFVSEPKCKELVSKVKNIIALFLISILFGTYAEGQVVWPGEVSQNAKVNNIDVLYIGLAFGETGTPRGGVWTTWTPQSYSAWSQSFSNGINYAYADCDGNGTINELDIEVIDFHFQQISGTASEEGFLVGNPTLHPGLKFDESTLVVTGPNTFEIDLYLGDETHLVDDFYGVAFSINYADFENNGVASMALNLLPGSWIGANDTPLTFIKDDVLAEEYQVAIVRTNQETVDGGGPIARLSIVMEDIVFGINSGTLNVDKIKLIDEYLSESPVAGSSLKLGGIASSSTSVVEPEEWQSWYSIYPNPVVDELNIQALTGSVNWTMLEVHHVSGKRVYHKDNFSSSVVIDMNNQPAGSYYLQLYTKQGLIVHNFIKY